MSEVEQTPQMTLPVLTQRVTVAAVLAVPAVPHELWGRLLRHLLPTLAKGTTLQQAAGGTVPAGVMTEATRWGRQHGVNAAQVQRALQAALPVLAETNATLDLGVTPTLATVPAQTDQDGMLW
jgi:hypothetical protein